MPDFPDPKSPLNENEKRVFGWNAIRHPITGYPLEMGGHESSHPAHPPNIQARAHIVMVARSHGLAVAAEMKRKLDEFEASGGVVNLPASDLPRGFERALMKG